MITAKRHEGRDHHAQRNGSGLPGSDSRLHHARANKGYRLDAVLVDGKPVDTERTYRFAPRDQKSHHIRPLCPSGHPCVPDDTGVSDYFNTKDHDAYVSGYPETGLVRMIS